MTSTLYQSSYPGSLIDQSVNVGLNIIQLMSMMQAYGADSSTIENPEWTYVIVDSSDHILAGKRTDGGVYIADF